MHLKGLWLPNNLSSGIIIVLQKKLSNGHNLEITKNIQILVKM